MLTVPNATSGSNAEQLIQEALDSVDIAIMVNAMAGTGWVSGGAVTAQGSPNNTVAVTAGTGVVSNVAAGWSSGNVTILSNNSGTPRLDLVLYRVGTGLMALEGSPTASPYTPFTSPVFTTDICLEAIYVATGAGSPTITSAELVDKRGPACLPALLFDPTGIVGSSANPQVLGATATQTVTNKRITKRTLSTPGPSATPSINTDTCDVVHLTACATNITSMTTNLTGTPVDGDTLRVSFTDNGSPITIAWGASFEAAAELPTKTVASTRLDTNFYWNTETSKWRCEGSAPGPLVQYVDLASTNANATTSTTMSLITNGTQSLTLTLGVGTWVVYTVLSLSASTAGQVFVAMVAEGTAVFTRLGTTGPPGAKQSSPTGTQADNHDNMSWSDIITVTTAGTVQIDAALDATGTMTVVAQDTSTSQNPVQVSYVYAHQIG